MHSKRQLLNNANDSARSACPPLALSKTETPVWESRLSRSAKLYLILDGQVNPYDRLFDIAREAIPAGVDIIQLRDKNGSTDQILKFLKELIKLTNHRIPLIINDRADLMRAGNASGVHLGQEDMSVADARRLIGNKAVIGVSCQTMEQAQRAVQDGADYIGFGSVFKTLTKPQRSPMNLNLLALVAKSIPIPVFAIGGINNENLEQLTTIGIHRIAVCRAVSQAENVGKAVERFKKSLSQSLNVVDQVRA